MSSNRDPRDGGTTEALTSKPTPRFTQPLSDKEVWHMLWTAANSDRIMAIVEGNWERSARQYDTREDAARALVFDLSFYTNYRFSQVQRLFKQTAMRSVFTDEEIDDIVEEAYYEQDGRSYPTFT